MVELKELQWDNIPAQLNDLGYPGVIIDPNSFRQRGNGYYRYCGGNTLSIRLFGITQQSTFSFHLSMTDDEQGFVDVLSRALGLKPYCRYTKMLEGGDKKKHPIVFYEWTVGEILSEIASLRKDKGVLDLTLFLL